MSRQGVWQGWEAEVQRLLPGATSVLQHGFRRMLERPDRRTLSVFSLGLRWLDRARFHLISPLARLLLPFP
jgi:hypothetical protein